VSRALTASGLATLCESSCRELVDSAGVAFQRERGHERTPDIAGVASAVCGRRLRPPPQAVPVGLLARWRRCTPTRSPRSRPYASSTGLKLMNARHLWIFATHGVPGVVDGVFWDSFRLCAQMA